MKSRTRLGSAALLILVVAVSLVGGPSAPATANHSPCTGFVGPAEVGVEAFVVDVAGEFYLDVRYLAEDENHLFSIWIYQETNGDAGLQRGGNPILCEYMGCTTEQVDPCVQAADPDTLIL